MSEATETGSALAWRVLATLEAGTLVVAGAALVAAAGCRAVGSRAIGSRVREVPVESVMITNTSSALGTELARQIQCRGCSVVTGEASSGATSVAESQVDALIVVGAQPKADGLEGLSRLVSEDVYDNLKSLETLSKSVKPGGRMVWTACTGDAGSGAFSGAAAAFDNVLRAQLDLIANTSQCKLIWIGRCQGVKEAVKNVIDTLLPSDSNSHDASRFSVRNMAAKVRGYVWRWLKIVS